MALRQAANDEFAIAVTGLQPLQRAIKRTEGDLPVQVRAGLKDISEAVRARAAANVHSRSGRLRAGVKVSVKQKSVSVYDDVVYARVQDQGGRVGRGHQTLLTRASVSQYMTRAVQGSQAEIEARVEQLLDDLANDFDG